MAVVTFNPDRTRRRSHHRTGLVLRGRGRARSGLDDRPLACLQDRLPHAAAETDLILGTSAGSALAAALRCRATVDELAAWQCGDVTGIGGEPAALAAQDGPLPPLPRLRFGSLPLAVAALLFGPMVTPTGMWRRVSGRAPGSRR